MRQPTTNQPPQWTPLERLLHEKRRVNEECELRKLKLNADCAYIQAHASGLLFAGLSSLLFPSTSKRQATEKDRVKTGAVVPGAGALEWSDLLLVGKGLLPVVWEIAQPMLVAWGIRKAKKWFFGLFFSKKK